MSSSSTYSSSSHLFFSPASYSPSSGGHTGHGGGLTTGPIFEKDVYEVEISETAPPHSVVFRLRRPDSKVLLTISSGNEGQDFFLEETSGVLYTSKWLDAETKSTYTLTIDSRDRRPNRIGDLSRRRQSVAKIIVKITDGNKIRIFHVYAKRVCLLSGARTKNTFLMQREHYYYYAFLQLCLFLETYI